MRTEKMRQRNIQKVFAAAPILFAKYGVFETTLQMIARQAGLSTRSVVNYFATRENLLYEVYARYYRLKAEEVKNYGEETKYLKRTGKEQILTALKAYLDDVKANYQDLCSLIEIQAVLVSSGKLNEKTLHKEWADAIEMLIKDAYEKGVEDGSIHNKDLDADTEIPLLLFTVKGLYKQYATALKTGDRKSSKAYAAAIEALFGHVSVLLDK